MFLLKSNLASMSCSRGISFIIAKNKNSIFIVLVTNSCVRIFRKIKRLTVCLKWLSVFTVLSLKSVKMLMFGIRMYVFSNCMTKITNCAVVFISICMFVKISAAGRGWMIA